MDIEQIKGTLPVFFTKKKKRIVFWYDAEKEVERIGRKYMLSRKIYEFVNRKGVYTRKRGLDRETNKHLLIKHITDNQKTGSRFRELREVLPSLSKDQVQKLLAEMKKQMMITLVGKTSAARWYPNGTAKRQNNE